MMEVGVMPKEKIGNEPRFPGDEPGPYACVGWHRDASEVQIAVLHDDSPFRWDLTEDRWELCPTPEQIKAHDGKPFYNCGAPTDAHRSIETPNGVEVQHKRQFGDAPFDGWYMSLNRQQINDLIRVLRRARDAAYGRDE